ncbi:hypothetical protein [Humibacter ginsengisoli]
MTSHKLVSARPWDDEEARNGLLDRAVSAEGAIGSTRIAVLPEPLIKTVDGIRARPFACSAVIRSSPVADCDHR